MSSLLNTLYKETPLQTFFLEDSLFKLDRMVSFDKMLGDSFDGNMKFSKGVMAGYEVSDDLISLFDYIAIGSNGSVVPRVASYYSFDIADRPWPSTLDELKKVEFKGENKYNGSDVKNFNIHCKTMFAKQYLLHKALINGANPWLSRSFNDTESIPVSISSLLLSDALELFKKIMELPGAMSYEDLMKEPMDLGSTTGRSYPSVWHALMNGKNEIYEAQLNDAKFCSPKIIEFLFKKGIFPDTKEGMNHPLVGAPYSVLRLAYDYGVYDFGSKLLKVISDVWRKGNKAISEYSTDEVAKVVFLLDEIEGVTSDVQFVEIIQLLKLNASDLKNKKMLDIGSKGRFKYTGNNIDALPGEWNVEGVFIHKLLSLDGSKNIKGYLFSNKNEMDESKSCLLGDGSFSVFTIYKILLDEKCDRGEVTKDIGQFLGYLNYKVKVSSANSNMLNVVMPWLLNVEKEFKDEDEKADFLRASKEALFFTKGKDFKFVFSSDDDKKNIFFLYAYMKLREAVAESKKNGEGVLEVLEKSPYLDLIVFGLMFRGSVPGVDGDFKKSVEVLSYLFENSPGVQKIIGDMKIPKQLKGSIPELLKFENYVLVQKSLQEQNSSTNLKPTRF